MNRLRSLALMLALIATPLIPMTNTAHAVVINSTSVIFDPTNNGMSIDLSFSSLLSPPTTQGIETLSLDFDGPNAPFVSTAMVFSSSTPLSGSYFELDYAIFQFATPITTATSLNILLSGLDFTTLLSHSNQDVDILVNEMFLPNGPGGGGCGSTEPGCVEYRNIASQNGAVAIPAPAPLALLGVGLLAFGLSRRAPK